MEGNLAIIGASYLQLPMIKKAKEMGYTTHVFAWESGDVGEKEADYFYPLSIVELERITEKCKEIGVCGVCSIASDLASITVNYVANRLGLVGNSMETTYKSTNKHLMRNCFKMNGDPSPRSVLVDEKTNVESLDLAYPVIVKPTDRSGSRGVIKLDSEDGLQEAISQSINESFERKAVVEEFVYGQEYSVEGISYKGQHKILAVTLKYTTGAPHFIETGHFEPAPLGIEIKQKIEEIIIHALNSLGIENGASHSEIKIDSEGNIKIIEIGGRMGGDCIGSDLVFYSTGIDYVKAVIQIACNERPDLSPQHSGFPASVHYIFTERDIEKMEKIRQEAPDRFLRQVYMRRDLLNKTSNSSDRAGCYIIKETEM